MLNEYELVVNESSQSDLQWKLIHSFDERNIQEFKKILNFGIRNGKIDINYFYSDPYNGTLLDTACSSTKTSHFVRLLIQYGADVNKVNKLTKKPPLLVAVDESDFDTVEALLEYPDIDLNITDGQANTALHIAAVANNATIVDRLLDLKVDPNLLNCEGHTAISIALLEGNKECVSAFLKHPSVNVPEDEIKSKFPDLLLMSPKDSLFKLLYNGDFESFASKLLTSKWNLNDSNGKYTFMQFLCERGFCDQVKWLIDHGANVNATCTENVTPPVMLAASRGYWNVVRTLVSSGNVNFEPVNGETVLHSIINGIVRSQDIEGASAEERNYQKCLQYILDNVSEDKLNINQPDNDGCTVLHYAAKLNDANIIKILLKKGAYIGYKNKEGEMAVVGIPRKIFEEYLNECIETNGKHPRDDNYEIIYKYNFLLPPRKLINKNFEAEPAERYDVVSETEPLLEMSLIPELRSLLKHPLLTSFLNIKWYTIRKYFYINAFFYFLFWISLTVYILKMYNTTTETDRNNMIFTSKNQFSNLWIAVSLLSILLVMREVFQFLVSPIRYLKSFENWLEICLIISTFTILNYKLSYEDGRQAAAIAILLSWTDLVLLIGRHPLLSTNVEMFKTVCVNFLKILSWYSIFILAFALSFYMLFGDITTEEGLQFNDPGASVFKSMIMLTGEFDAGSIPFSTFPITSHIIFVMFVFLIAIVLFNLLNGLAVSDTQKIKNDAEIVGNLSRARLISYIEAVAIADPFYSLRILSSLTLMCRCTSFHRIVKSRKHVKMLYKRTNIFPYVLPNYEIRVLVNQYNRVIFINSQMYKKQLNQMTSYFDSFGIWLMDPEIVKVSKEILSQATESDHSDILNEYVKQLAEYKKKLEDVEKTSKRTEELLLNVIEVLKDRL